MSANAAQLIKVTARRDKSGLSATEHYFVQCTARTDTAITALAAADLPSYATPKVFDGNILQCTDMEAEEADSANPAYAFIVRATYTTPTGAGEEQEDPLDKEPEISFATHRERVPFHRDLDDFPVANSAGDPFDPPAETDEGFRVIRITARYAENAYTDSQFAAFIDTLNDDTFLTYPAGQVKCYDVSARRMVENNIPFMEVDLEFHVNPLGWFRFIVDQGYRKKLSDGTAVAITDKDGNPPNSPVLLDGDGGVLEEGAPAQVRLFVEFDEADFSFFDVE